MLTRDQRRQVTGSLTHAGVLTLILALHATVLQWTWLHEIVPAFNYLGAAYRTPEPIAYGIALVVTLAVGLMLPRRLVAPSDFVLWVFYVLVIVASNLMPHYIPAVTPMEALRTTAVVSAISALVIAAVRGGPKFTLRLSGQQSIKTVGLVVAVVSAVMYGYLALTVGLRLELVGLADVRDLRFAYRDQIAAAGGYVGYVVRLQGNVLNPFLMAAGVYTRRWSWVAAGILGQALLFPITGYKLTMFSAPAIVALCLLFLRRPSVNGTRIFGWITGLAFLAIAYDRITGQLYAVEYYINRLLLTGGTLLAGHIAVFDDRPKANFGDTFPISLFTDSPYPTSTAFVVGADYLNSPVTSANAHLFADGYANAGYAGMLIEALVFVVILWLLDATGKHLPVGLAAAILILPTIATVNSSSFTAVITNGYLFAGLLMAALPADGWRQRRRGRSGSTATEASAPIAAA